MEQGAVLEYDDIVVGSGSSGGVLAARLAERSDATILLLEAGGPDSPEAIAVPAAWPTLLGTEVDWAYATAPQADTRGSAAGTRCTGVEYAQEGGLYRARAHAEVVV